MNKKQTKLLKTVEINLHYAHEAMRELNKDYFSDDGQEYPVPTLPTDEEKENINKILTFCRSHGYVVNDSGEHIHFKDINNKNADIRNSQERSAVNAAMGCTYYDGTI